MHGEKMAYTLKTDAKSSVFNSFLRYRVKLNEEKKPIVFFKSKLEVYNQPFTARWTGVTGNDKTPSLGEYETFLQTPGSLIFYGTERFLSYITPNKVAALNMPECQMMIVLDQSQTNLSYGRQGKIDAIKNKTLLSLEQPVESAMLLSLAGVRCLIGNQWNCSIQENGTKLDLLMKDLLGKGRTSGQTIRYLADPNLRRKEELDEIAKAKEEKKTAEKKKGAKSDKGGKADKAGKNAKEKGGKEVAPKAGSGTDEEGESTRPGTPLEEPLPIERTWFTTVCYGLPNYIIMPQSGAKR